MPATTPTTAVPTIPAASARGVLGMYAQLTKARLSLLVLWTTAVGYVLAATAGGVTGGGRFAWTLIGTALAAGAANTLNQVLEIGRDRIMERTRNRPLAAGTISTGHAIALAFVLGVTGVAILAMLVNALAASLASLTIVLYVMAYTPLKTRSTLNTLVGAVCGAVPPMIGWVGATGHFGAGAWVLGGILFVWQIPHFLALAWLYRDDYARGRFRMLPVIDRDGRITGQIVVLTSLMLLPLALTATLVGMAGWLYTIGAVGLGLWMLNRAVRMYRDRSRDNARSVFLASLVYLATLLMLLVIDRGPAASFAPPTVHVMTAVR